MTDMGIATEQRINRPQISNTKHLKMNSMLIKNWSHG